MRGATHCARRVKQLFRNLRSKLGKVNRPAVTDPISQVILGVFSRDLPEAKAREAMDQLRSIVVDYNELRVISPLEMAEHLKETAGANAYPDLRIKCEDLSRALNKIFAIEHTVSLERLVGASAKDTRTYLDRIDGLEPYTRARVRLLGLQQHAVPLDEAMWAAARAAEIVDAKCTLDEAQIFLERQVSEEDALDFVALLRKHAWTEMATAVRKGEVERIRSVPPDRTSRNMLQTIAPMGEETEEIEDVETAESVPARGSKPRGRARRGRAADETRPGRSARPTVAPVKTAPAAPLKPGARPPSRSKPAAPSSARGGAKRADREASAAKAPRRASAKAKSA